MIMTNIEEQLENWASPEDRQNTFVVLPFSNTSEARILAAR
jgi:hypothetical protein